MRRRIVRPRRLRVHAILAAVVLLTACGDATPERASSTTVSAGTGGGVSDGGGGGGLGGKAGVGGAAGAGGAGGTAGSGPDCDFPAPEPGLVVTKYGAVRGMQDGDTWSFRGIPYSAPPVGELRWHEPEEPACWSGEREAKTFGAQCIQGDATSVAPGSEDCLTLNVWAPLAPPARPRTVMVFIHGGGNQGGSSSGGGDADPFASGRPYVEQADVVFVTLNYRLGALGFLAHPALSAESSRHASGNYGLYDQVLALRWVKDNIAAFGGDPARVMVFGESAGAIDTCALMASPLAAGLFQRALMESGACVAVPLAAREDQGALFASGLGCASDDADCLRALPPESVVGAQTPLDLSVLGLETLPWGLTIDGAALPAAPLELIAQGSASSVPFVVGSNAEEMFPAVPLFVSQADYEQKVDAYFGQAKGSQVLATYDPSVYGSPRGALVALETDVNFTCPSRRVARAAATGGSPVYRYFFTHACDGGIAGALGAFHALELVFVFQHPNVPSWDFDTAELALEAQMLGYWSRFAIAGDPNGGMAPTWPAYAPGGDAYLALDTPISNGDGIRTAECDVLDALSP